MTAPTIKIAEPMPMLRLRPSHSPMKLVVTAPAKQPISNWGLLASCSFHGLFQETYDGHDECN